MNETTLPVAVIGAGPVGLAAAADLVERGERPMVLEAGPEIGHAVRQWGHVRMFSPWRYNIDPVARRLLRASGWRAPDPEALPTGDELVERYLTPLASLPELARCIRTGTRVVAIGRKDADKVATAGREDRSFVLRTKALDGTTSDHEARAVIDASGSWGSPNPLGADGYPAQGEEQCADRIAHGVPDVRRRARARYAGKSVMVVGSGHSAANVVLDLLALQDEAPATRLLWVMRRENLDPVFGGGAADALPARGELGQRAKRAVEAGRVEVLTPFRIRALAPSATGRVVVTGQLGAAAASVEVDEIVAATGFRPDLSMLREVRLALDPWLESAHALGPLIDPNLHSCGTVPAHGALELAHPERDLFIVGMKSYGRAPTFLLATGYEQVRSVAAALTGDRDASSRVELKLPESGVCRGPARPLGVGCCGAGHEPDRAAAAPCCG